MSRRLSLAGEELTFPTVSGLPARLTLNARRQHPGPRGRRPPAALGFLCEWLRQAQRLEVLVVTPTSQVRTRKLREVKSWARVCAARVLPSAVFRWGHPGVLCWRPFGANTWTWAQKPGFQSWLFRVPAMGPEQVVSPL